MPPKTPDARMRNFALNRQAGHLYHLLEKFEAGIELSGTEVKSVREGKVNIKDAYATIRGDEAWLVDCHVSGYLPGSYLNHTPLRERRLLLHRKEIDRLSGRVREKGLTLVPLRLYLKGNKIKCELALAKGKKIYDHRETARRRVIEREADQDVRDHQKRWR
jgi:SsrA-binding protein